MFDVVGKSAHFGGRNIQEMKIFNGRVSHAASEPLSLFSTKFISHGWSAACFIKLTANKVPVAPLPMIVIFFINCPRS
jgi:hypothetical protein